MTWREETEEETVAREAEDRTVYIRCRTCHFGSIETEFGEDQCPDCSSTMFVPVERCKHKRLDGHWHCKHMDDGALCYDREHEVWCPGAGIGDDDATT